MRSLLLLILVSAHATSFVISGVPFVRQDTQYCGPAALSSVMSYHGTALDQQEIAKATYSAKLKGSLISDLENFARNRGFETVLAQGSLETIKGFVDRQKPVIALVDLGSWVVSRPHYLVIIGYTAEGFLAHTGYEASQLFTYEKFTRIWEKIGATYLVVSR